MIEPLVLSELFKGAKETVQSLLSQWMTAREKSWEELILALDALSELSSDHVKAVAQVTAPILADGDLVETSRRYDLLVNNPDFPLGYGKIRGVLDGVLLVPAFRDPMLQERVRAVRDNLLTFQFAVFTLEWDSYKVADAIAEAARVSAMDDPSESKIEEIADLFLKTFTEVFREATNKQRDPEALKTIEELITLLQQWFTSWQRHVQRSLHGGLPLRPGEARSDGLGMAIGQLKMAHYA